MRLPENETNCLDAMMKLTPLTDGLSREQTFEKLCKLLPQVSAADLIQLAPVLAEAIPELKPMIGFDQHSPHHAYDVFTHTAYVVENVPSDLTLRWAALLHDTGKIPTFTQDETGRGHFYGHAQKSAEIANEILRRFNAPVQLREDIVTLIGLHMTKIQPNEEDVRRWLNRLGTDTVHQLLALQEADMGSKGTGTREEMEQFPRLRAMIHVILDEK